MELLSLESLSLESLRLESLSSESLRLEYLSSESLSLDGLVGPKENSGVDVAGMVEVPTGVVEVVARIELLVVSVVEVDTDAVELVAEMVGSEEYGEGLLVGGAYGFTGMVDGAEPALTSSHVPMTLVTCQFHRT